MSDHWYSSPRYNSRTSKSRGLRLNCGGYHEELGRGHREPFGGRRGLGSRGGDKIGWGRNGAVRLDGPPTLRRGRDEGRDGGREEQSDGIDSSRLRSGSGVDSDRTGTWVGPDRLSPHGGPGNLDPTAGLRMGMGMGGSDPLASPMMGRTPFDSPRAVNRQISANDAMLGLRHRALHHGLGMEQSGYPVMTTRQRLMDDRHGLRSPGSMGNMGSFDMRVMDHLRMPFSPPQHSPMQNRFANYRFPYVEDYQGSEMEVSSAQQAAMQQMMSTGGNSFLNEGQYGEIYGGMGGMGPTAQAGEMGQMGQMGQMVNTGRTGQIGFNGGMGQMGPMAGMGGGMDGGMGGMGGGTHQYR
ncbi:unnamed protein product [Diplocarpon coronariae]